MHKRLTIFTILALLSLFGCSKDEPLKVAQHDWIGYQFSLLAQREKPQEFNDFRIIKTLSASETIEKLKNQEIAAGYLTLDEVLSTRDQGVPLSVVLITNISAGADVVIGRQEINSKADIINKTIAYESNALGKLLLISFLKHYGLTEEDIQHYHMPYHQHDFAFNNNEVDFIVTYYPQAATILDKQNGVEVFSSLDIPNTIVDVLAVNNEMVSPYSQTSCNLTKAHVFGVKQYYENPNDTEFRLASLLNISHPVVLSSIAKITIPSLLANKQLLSSDGNIETITKNLQLLMQNEKMIDKNQNIESIIDNRCINDLLESHL